MSSESLLKEPCKASLPANVCRCKDGTNALIAGNGDSIFKCMCKAMNRDDLGNDPTLDKAKVTMPDGTESAVPGIVPKLSRVLGQFRRNFPTIGQDTDTVFREVGLTEEKIAPLNSKGVVALA